LGADEPQPSNKSAATPGIKKHARELEADRTVCSYYRLCFADQAQYA
jgi:hypothetical protein